jgi:hypothetical protein
MTLQLDPLSQKIENTDRSYPGEIAMCTIKMKAEITKENPLLKHLSLCYSLSTERLNDLMERF